MGKNPDWYRDEKLLLRELKRGGESVRADRSTKSWAASRGASDESRLQPPIRIRVPEIAGYEDLEELGRGGQGIVYGAMQHSTQRKVAIKVLLAGAWAPEKHKRRFQREVELIAALQHPHIVRLYDSGLTDEGYPYYVMEFIAGVGLDELIAAVSGGQPWVLSGYEHLAVIREEKPNRRAPSCFAMRSVLELMAKVCEAVAYAHQRGMIHRDLKPSNIRIDTQAEPHVLDFGLGKQLLGTPPNSSGAQVSSTGEFMGSLAWASPEQTEGLPDRIDARADVYSLGIILFQMLTGQFPYPVVGGFRQVLDRIKNAEPLRPSTLRKDLDDEVDTIVLKCLAKEPERRYQDAGELARDVRHYVADEPIEAKSESVTYCLRKRLRQHRMAVALVVSLVMLATMSVVSALTLWRAGMEASSTASSDFAGRAAFSEAVNGAGSCRVHEVAKLRPSDVEAADFFGRSVAITRDPVWRLTATSPGDDDQGENSGAAYVYRFDGWAWNLEAKLLASEAAPGSLFGHGTKIHDETLLIGGYQRHEDGTTGRLTYVFGHDGSEWVEQARIPPSDDGREPVISSVFQPPLAIVDVTWSDHPDLAPISRAFLRDEGELPDGTGGIEHVTLTVSDGPRGGAAALERDVIVVTVCGCNERLSSCDPVPGTAYIFRRDPFQPSTWIEEARLAPSDSHAGDRFGCHATKDGDVVVIGAKQNDTQAKDAGSAYIFRYDGESWIEEAQLCASDYAEMKQFGCCVRVHDDIVLIGAYGDDENGPSAGAVYVFRFDGVDWVEEAKLLVSDRIPKQLLGYSVAFAGDTAVAGAYFEQGVDFGSVYVFRGLSDCNSNGELDACDVARGISRDRNENGLPDECEPFPQMLSQNTTDGSDDVLLGPPDDDYVRIKTGVVEYDFGDWRVIDGDGPDFNIYEFESGHVEFGQLDVQVSEDGGQYTIVEPAPRAPVRIEGDGARGVDRYIKSFDLAGSGLSSVRYVRIAGTGAGYARDGAGFELDAIGAVHFVSAGDE